MIFTYKARDMSGGLATGEVEAKNPAAAKKAVADMGLLPVLVAAKGLDFSLPKFLRRKKANVNDIIAFTRQFEALFRAGIPIDRVLTTLSKQTPNKGLGRAIEKIQQDVSSGSSLKDAFAKHGDYFDELYCNMLGVGEAGGVLEGTLKDLSSILKKEYTLISGIKSATLYPKIVITVFVIVVFVMMIFVIPGFASFYSGYGAQLPLPTRILMGISNFFASYWYVMLTLGIGGFVGFKKYASTEKGRFNVDRMKFSLPVFGKLHMMVSNARFGHLLATLYKSGFPLAESLQIVAKTIGNKAYEAEVNQIKSEVETGSSLGDSMARRKYFSALMTESAAIGEQTGSLDDMLENAAAFYDDEVSHMLEQLTTMLEPLLLGFIFVMVALLAFAIFLPMWKVSSVVLQPGGK